MFGKETEKNENYCWLRNKNETKTTVDTRVLAEKFMPKPGPLSLGGRLIRGTDF